MKREFALMNANMKSENERLREIKTSSEDIFDGVILHVKRALRSVSFRCWITATSSSSGSIAIRWIG